MKNDLRMEKRVVGIAGVVIMLLLGIVGYFVQRLVTSTDRLNENVQQLRIIVESNQKQNEGIVNVFSIRIDRLEKDVNCIQQELAKFRPNFRSE
jgi:hypothetical protein